MKKTNILKIIPYLLTIAILCGCNLTVPTTPTVELSPSPEEITFELSSIDHTLTSLTSYRTNLVVEFDGQRDGETVAGRIESLIEQTEPDVLRRYVHTNTDLPNDQIVSGVAEFIRIGEQVYSKKAGEEDWFIINSTTAAPTDFGFFDLERLLLLPTQLTRPAQLEFLNEVNVRHYRFDHDDISDPNLILSDVRGDLWVTDKDEYLVQYRLSATISVIIPPPNAYFMDQGQLTIEYSVSGMNEPVEIIPPVAALNINSTFNKLTHLEDAKIIAMFPDLVEYSSHLTPTHAGIFYRDQLTKLGWTEKTIALFEEKAELHFTRAEEEVTIFVTPYNVEKKEAKQIKVLLQTTIIKPQNVMTATTPVPVENQK
ncbi:hypothetical protein QUF63_04555 [Anaerolineales bacterium HSG25]|nr:hypothetical protein [Anaerolineales bacterium HSG25]